MQTGFITLYGTTYYLHPSGAMATGWQEIQGETYYFNNSGAQQNIDRRAIVLGETSTKAVPMGDVNAMGNTFNNTRLNGKAFSSVSFIQITQNKKYSLNLDICLAILKTAILTTFI